MMHIRKVLTVAAVSVIGLVSLAAAQMMGSHGSHMPMGQNDTSSQSATAVMSGGNMNMPMDSLVTGMSNNYSMMSRNLDSLQAHLESMMRIHDLYKLKGEMRKEEAALKVMRKEMGQQQNMYDRMLSMMQSGHFGGLGMMNSTMSNAHQQKHN